MACLIPRSKDVLISAGESEHNLPVFYDPEGTPGIQAPLHSWLKAVHELLAGGEMNTATQLLRFPQTLSWLESKGVEPDVRVWFKELDKLHAKHLSRTLEDGIQFARRSNSAVTEALEKLAGLVEDLQSGSFEDKIKDLLRGALSSIPWIGESRKTSHTFSYFPSSPTGCWNYPKFPGLVCRNVFQFFWAWLRAKHGPKKRLVRK